MVARATLANITAPTCERTAVTFAGFSERPWWTHFLFFSSVSDCIICYREGPPAQLVLCFLVCLRYFACFFLFILFLCLGVNVVKFKLRKRLGILLSLCSVSSIFFNKDVYGRTNTLAKRMGSYYGPCVTHLLLNPTGVTASESATTSEG